MTVTLQVFFGRFWALTTTLALANKRKLQNPLKITQHINCHSQAPIGFKILCNFNYNGHRYLFLLNALFEEEKCLLVGPYEFEVQV